MCNSYHYDKRKTGTVQREEAKQEQWECRKSSTLVKKTEYFETPRKKQKKV